MYENNDGTYFRGRKFAFPSVSGYVFVWKWLSSAMWRWLGHMVV
jgi:hypothetical protein